MNKQELLACFHEAATSPRKLMDKYLAEGRKVVLTAPVYTDGYAETVNSRVFNSPKNYYFPIPAAEVKRSPNLRQNPGWEVEGSAQEETVVSEPSEEQEAE